MFAEDVNNFYIFTIDVVYLLIATYLLSVKLCISLYYLNLCVDPTVSQDTQDPVLRVGIEFTKSLEFFRNQVKWEKIPFLHLVTK